MTGVECGCQQAGRFLQSSRLSRPEPAAPISDYSDESQHVAQLSGHDRIVLSHSMSAAQIQKRYTGSQRLARAIMPVPASKIQIRKIPLTREKLINEISS
jgi:hypothetical protein